MSPMTVFFWVAVLFLAILPQWRQYRIAKSRMEMIRALETERNSRVITLIHRQEPFNLMGLLSRQFISIEDSEAILRAIRFTPSNLPIDLLLHTPGGLVLAAEQIARAIIRHQAKVTVFVPHYAMSGGALLALAADEIVMDENAVLGPIDPQLGRYPAASILKVLEIKPIGEVDDETVILADLARKAQTQVEDAVRRILTQKMPHDRGAELARCLTEGRWTHDYPIPVEELRQMGIEIQTQIPDTVYRLMELYPQPSQGRPSVQYIPIPYHRKPES